MSDQQQTQAKTAEAETVGAEQQAPAAPEQAAPTRKPGGILAGLALLLAVAALAASGWLFWQGQQAAQQLQNRLTSLDTQLAAQQQALNAKLEAQARQQAEAAAVTAALEHSMKSLHEEVGRDRSAWAVAETSYYLELANARLQLLQDVPTALQALLLADTRLQALGDPVYIPVREQLAKEIAALRAVAQPDLAGSALLLGGLVTQIPNLPLHAPAELAKSAAAQTTAGGAEDATPRWQQEAEKIWAVMRELVQVRRTDKRIEPLLHPEEQRLLVANLQLQLQVARYAVLSRDTGLLHDSVNMARDWLLQHYDQDAAATRAVLESLDTLGKLELAPAKPDISGSLRQLRALASKGKPAA